MKVKAKKARKSLPPITLDCIRVTVKVFQDTFATDAFFAQVDQSGKATDFYPGADKSVVIGLNTLKIQPPETSHPTVIISNAQFAITISSTNGAFSTNLNFTSGLSEDLDVEINTKKCPALKNSGSALRKSA